MYYKADVKQFLKDYSYCNCKDILCALVLARADERNASEKRIVDVYREVIEWYEPYHCEHYDVYYDDIDDILECNYGKYSEVTPQDVELVQSLFKWDVQSLTLMWNICRIYADADSTLSFYWCMELSYTNVEDILNNDRICHGLSTELELDYLDWVCYELQWLDFEEYNKIHGGLENINLRNYFIYEISDDCFEFQFNNASLREQLSFVDILCLEKESIYVLEDE